MESVAFLARENFPALLDAVTRRGYRWIGPQLKQGAIVYAEITGIEDLPAGFHDRQAPGEYQCEQTGSPRLFGWANGPQALKPLLFAPREVLWQARPGANGSLQFETVVPAARATAVLGVRACDLAALALLDRHFLPDEHADTHYATRRGDLVLVAVNCTHPAATCFCASTGDGPVAEQGYDLLLDELDDGFRIEWGTPAGESLFGELPLTPLADRQDVEIVAARRQAADKQTRQLPSRDLKQALFSRLSHERWQTVAERCLACGNCTSVCPTCFCFREQETPELDGSSSQHSREWDSCFTEGHSYIHGHVIRPDTRLRYRQWMTHKLGSWHDQYGRSGCVGCGRCITWCPVGIDITEEAGAICAGDE